MYIFQPLSELSETASDAWSTDVLASDNEEKQAEELSEFDQVIFFYQFLLNDENLKRSGVCVNEKSTQMTNEMKNKKK